MEEAGGRGALPLLRQQRPALEGGDDDDAEQVGRSDGAMEEAGHTAVVPSPCCDNDDH